MATPTDLDGLLFGENGVEPTLSDKLANGPTDDDPLTGPYTVRARYWPPNASTYETVSDFPVADTASLNVQNVMSKLHHDITEQLGAAPIGRMEVRIFEDGRAAYPLVKRIRTLTAPGHSSDLNRDLLLRRVVQLENFTSEAFRTLQENNAQLVIHSGNLATALQNAATVRTASSAGSDLGTIGAVVGLGVLLVGLPSIQKMLGLPPGSSIEDTIRAAQAAITRAGKPKELREPGPLAPALPAGALAPENGEPEGDNGPDNPRHIQQVIDLLNTPEGHQRIGLLAQMAEAQGADVWTLLGVQPPDAEPEPAEPEPEPAPA